MWAKKDAGNTWLLPAILLYFMRYIDAKFTPEKCRDIGFTSNLLCSSCDELPQFNLDFLVGGCQDCCQADQNEKASVKVGE